MISYRCSISVEDSREQQYRTALIVLSCSILTEPFISDRIHQILAITNTNPGNSGSPLMVSGAFKISGSRWGR